MKSKKLRRKNRIEKVYLYVFLFSIILMLIDLSIKAQNVSITNDSTYTPKTSAILDVKATDKGLLIPRVSLTSTSSASPISSPDSSLLVYNKATASDVTPGYYYWDGAKWLRINNRESSNIVTKNTNATLLKSETLVMASGDITLTLPVITSGDNGLEITIKNTGSYVDLVVVQGNGGAMIDGTSLTSLYRWQSKTFIANGANWVLEDYEEVSENLFEISPKGSWTTIPEIIAFLNAHMTGPALIRIGFDAVDIAETQTINLPFPVTFQGMSFGHTTISAVTGLTGKPMFRCFSECYFKMLMFDATTLTSYGTIAGEDAIRYLGSGTYNEVKDCTFDRFYNSIVDSTNAELWIFECDISNAFKDGILVHDNTGGVKIRIAETDFINCRKGINLEKSTNGQIQLTSGSFLNAFATDTAIKYNATNFTFTVMQITNNMFNNVGKFIKGFDFTRSDGRDANAYIENNAGYETKRPHCKINVRNNTTNTTVATSGAWVKGVWTNTSEYICKFAISGNRITYLSPQSYDGLMLISGNVICNNDAKILSVAIVKNGNSAVRYGETTVKLPSSTQPYQWSTNVYLEDLTQGDYFELWITSSSDADVYKLQDVLWFTNTQ